MEKHIMSTNENQSKNLFKFLIPSLLGLLLFVIPLPYGNLFKLDGLSPINIGIGFLAELIKTNGNTLTDSFSIEEIPEKYRANYKNILLSFINKSASNFCKFKSPSDNL